MGFFLPSPYKCSLFCGQLLENQKLAARESKDGNKNICCEVDKVHEASVTSEASGSMSRSSVDHSLRFRLLGVAISNWVPDIGGQSVILSSWNKLVPAKGLLILGD